MENNDYSFLNHVRESYHNRETEEGLIIRRLLEMYEREKTTKNELKEELKNILEHSRRDELTGLYNRKAIKPFFRDIINSLNPKISNSKFSIITIDLDHFKSINDTYGHNVGDDVLKIVAEGMIRYFKKSDLGVRDGGDEFLIIALNCDIEVLRNKTSEMSNYIKNSVHKELYGKMDEYGDIIERPFDYTVSFGIRDMDRSSLNNVNDDNEFAVWYKQEKEYADIESYNMKHEHHAVRK